MERNNVKKAIEGVIFISDRPVSSKRLLQIFQELKKEEIQLYLDELISEWKELGRGFKLHEVAGGYQFRTSPEFSEIIIKFKQSKPFRLSRAALEVLAITAYRQPITRIEIEEIRGVDSSGVIALLLEKNLIGIKGRKEVIGRPFLYTTTEVFLETFGLNNLSDLPTLKELVEMEQLWNEVNSKDS